MRGSCSETPLSGAGVGGSFRGFLLQEQGQDSGKESAVAGIALDRLPLKRLEPGPQLPLWPPGKDHALGAA